MFNVKSRVGLMAMVLVLLGSMTFVSTLWASEASKINAEVRAAYKHLMEDSPAAKALAKKAHGVLIFPSIVKGGFMIGGQYGKGALIQNGKITAYYRSSAVSYGLQAGVQKFGYALFFLTEQDMDYLKTSDGWEVGVGPSIVVMDSGMAKSFTTTTVKDGVYAFFFSQKGLMAGLGLQGTKITRVYPL
jgi:lipid-binding SYLF domain-containing protein